MSATAAEIERKFRLEEPPPALLGKRGHRIFQGYLMHGEHREIRIRRDHKKCYLTVKDGDGLVRQETETTIPRKQFEILWPLTAGRRITKVRHRLRINRVTCEIDIYENGLSPLVIAEVEFPSIAASQQFSPPDYFVEEVTGKPEYRNVFLASHGLPSHAASDYQIGAVPYLLKDDVMHLVLITNSNGGRWLIPKGQPEPDMPRPDVALMEAVEEAGVIGSIHTGARARGRMEDGSSIYLYPVKVATLLKSWPERSSRKRDVLPADQAINKITDRKLAASVKRVVAKLH